MVAEINQTIHKEARNERTVRQALTPIAGAAVGNILEWFDYSIYGYLAATIAVVFFPSDDPSISLMAAFAGFAVAFVSRPFGALFFGSMGDRIGRRDTLVIVVTLISVSTFFVGVLPGFASIGIAAPVLLILLRLLQGFSAGGEAGGAVTFLAEYAPTARRGFVVGFYNVSGFLGAFLGSCLIYSIINTFSTETLTSWAWRLPFLVAGPIGIAALWLRLKIEDTPVFRESQAQDQITRTPIRQALSSYKVRIAQCTGIAAAHGVPYYLILVYFPSVFTTTGIIDERGAIFSTGLAFLAAIAIVPAGAAMSDWIGRKPVALFPAIVYLVAAIPLFELLNSHPSQYAVIAVMIGMGLMLGIYGGAPFAMMAELFPTRARYSAMSIGYNLAGVLFAGTTPFVSSALVRMTGNPVAPAYYLMFCAALAILSIVTSPETARVPMQELGRKTH